MCGQDVLQTIQQKKRFGSLPGVEVGKRLLAAVGNPQKGLAFIHIAGTNGKGSAAAFLDGILCAANIRTGLFTSPHLVDFTERIRVNGVAIPKEKAEEIGRRLLAVSLDAQPSMFDYCLAMALLHFQEQKCALVILETGLGGRLDATNAAGVPLVSLITKIGYDHTEFLGGTLSEIAVEKAGILKSGTRAVLESQEPEALAVLTERCKALAVPYAVVKEQELTATEDGFCYPGETPYRMRMRGAFQRENAMAAVLAARELAALGYAVTEEDLHRGIAETVWRGRMEVILKRPFLMIDGAHNADGAHALAKSLAELYPGEKFHFIMGVLADKDYREMVRKIRPVAAKITAVTPEDKRALDGERLVAYIRACGIEAEWKRDTGDAFRPFLSGDGGFDTEIRTVAFGSLHFIGEIMSVFALPSRAVSGEKSVERGNGKRRE